MARRILRGGGRTPCHPGQQPGRQGRKPEQRSGGHGSPEQRPDYPGAGCGFCSPRRFPEAHGRIAFESGRCRGSDTAVLLQPRSDPAQSAGRAELGRRPALLFRYISTGQGCVGMRVLCWDVLYRSPRSAERDRRISEPGDLGRYKSDLYDVGEGLRNLVAERETQHWLIGGGHTRIHYAKGPLVPWNDSSGSASRRAVVWIGIYVHPKMALSAWCVELAL